MTDLYLAWQTEPLGLIGVYDTVERAREACVEYGDAVQGPIRLNAVAPRESTSLPYSYWPFEVTR